MRTAYHELIAELAPGYDPRHIEAYMRVEHATLGHLSREAFAADVKICKACIDAEGLEAAEKCAKSFGL